MDLRELAIDLCGTAGFVAGLLGASLPSMKEETLRDCCLLANDVLITIAPRPANHWHLRKHTSKMSHLIVILHIRARNGKTRKQILSISAYSYSRHTKNASTREYLPLLQRPKITVVKLRTISFFLVTILRKAPGLRILSLRINRDITLLFVTHNPPRTRRRLLTRS